MNECITNAQVAARIHTEALFLVLLYLVGIAVGVAFQPKLDRLMSRLLVLLKGNRGSSDSSTHDLVK